MSTSPVPSAGQVNVCGTEIFPADSRDTFRQKIARITLDSMVQFVGLLDASGTVLEINQVALDAVGVGLSEVEGTPFWTTFWWQTSDATRATLQDAIERAAAGEFVRWDAEIYGRAGGKETIIIHASLRPVMDPQGKVVFITAEGRDITEKKAHEREIARQREELAQLDKLKSQFFANISHEFRTPLTLMMGPLEDALGEPDELSERNHARLDLAYRSSRRLLKLVNSLLDFSRIEAGRMEACYEPVDLAAATAELASVFRSAIERAGMELVVDCAPLAERVYVDREMWEKIVLNLLSNAFKFTFDGTIEVSLRPEGSAALLTVRDSGTGIPAEELPRLFERFHRVSGARGRSYEGTGIGLALVQELTRLHGGNVRVESQEDRGSAFLVTVPFGKSHLPADRIGASRALSSTGLRSQEYLEEALRWLPDEVRSSPSRDESSSGTPQTSAVIDQSNPAPRILLADDNTDMREYLRRLLGAYEVETAADGIAALRAARERRPDLVLTDVMMPGMDGFELLRELRADVSTRNVPVILLSARAGEESRIEGLEAGADDYLVKPFSAREVLARVKSQLDLTKLRSETEKAIGRHNERLRLLWEAAGVLLSTHEPDAMLRGLFAKIRESLGLDFYFHYMVSEPGDSLRLVSSAGVADENAERISRVDLGQAICGNVALGKEAIVATSIQQSDEPMLELAKGLGIRACACNPLLAGGRVLGTLSFGSSTRDRFEPEEIEFLETITHYVTVAYERLQLIGQLRDQDRRKDEFLATLAHELRNPLAPIRNGLQLMSLAQSNAGTLQQARAMMERQIRHMVRLVDDLLDVSRISRNKLELRKESVELAAVIGSAIETSRPVIEAGSHELAVSLPHDPVMLHADSMRLAQAISNLLNNAAKYTDHGGKIELSAEHANGEVVIRVRDNGIGIPHEKLSHIFKMFEQVERSMERSQGGLGIGLTLVQRLVEMHGGRVDACSEGAGRGSEFVVRLPVVRMPVTSGVPGYEVDLDRTHLSRRILVVDDNRDSADSLTTMLRLLGHEVATAYEGLGAVEMVRTFRPDIALLDLGMPLLNGFDAARRIRDDPELGKVMLVALTGWGQEEDKRRSQEAGFDAHIVKPIDLTSLENLMLGIMVPKELN